MAPRASSSAWDKGKFLLGEVRKRADFPLLAGVAHWHRETSRLESDIPEWASLQDVDQQPPGSFVSEANELRSVFSDLGPVFFGTGRGWLVVSASVPGHAE
jgi:hypothetical protein